MKLKHLFFNALAVMAFTACSNEAEEIKPAEKASTATLQLDMTGQYGTGSTDQTRALSLDGTEYPRFIHEEGVTDWSTHCFIRNEEGTVQFYALVDWNATTDADGNISLHIKNSTLTLQNSAGSDVSNTETLPKAGERWYIAGIAGGGVLDATNSNVYFGSDHTLDIALNPNQARVPLAFGWTRFTIPSNTERAPQIVVQFKPQGTLLSTYVNNRTNVNQLPLRAAIKVKSNALSQDGVFDYSLTAIRADYATSPKWAFTNETATTEIFVRNVTIDQNTGANCYIWAMPRTTAPAEGFNTRVGVAGYTYFSEGSSSEKPVAITRTFQQGNTYVAEAMDVYQPRIPIEYITTHNVATDGASFVTEQLNNLSGQFTYAQALEKFKYITIDSEGYHLGSRQDWVGAIAPGRILQPTPPDLDVVLFSETAERLDVYEEISVGGALLITTSNYRNTADRISYAIRHIDATNSHRTAYRYRPVGGFTGGNDHTSHVEVMVRYLGPSSSVTLDDVAQESFWSDPLATYITRVLPASGGLTETGGKTMYGSRTYYWSDNLPVGSRTRVSNMAGGFNGVGIVGAIPAQSRPVRLFKDEL